MLTVVIFHIRAPCQDPTMNQNATSQPISPARKGSACTPVWDICLQHKPFSNKLYCFNHYDKQRHPNCNSDKGHKCLNKHHLYVLGLRGLICILNICSSVVESVLMMNKTYDVISRSRWITVIYRYSSEWHSEGLKMSRFASVRSGNHAIFHNLSLALCQSLSNTFRLLSLLFESQQTGLSELLCSRETECVWWGQEEEAGRFSRESGCHRTVAVSVSEHFTMATVKQSFVRPPPQTNTHHIHLLWKTVNFTWCITWGVIFVWYSLGILHEACKGFKTDACAFQNKLVPNQSGLEEISASRNCEATAKELVVFDHNGSEMQTWKDCGNVLQNRKAIPCR